MNYSNFSIEAQDLFDVARHYRSRAELSFSNEIRELLLGGASKLEDAARLYEDAFLIRQSNEINARRLREGALKFLQNIKNGSL